MKLNRERILSLIPHAIGLFFIAMIPMFIFDATDIKIKLWTYRFYYQLFFFIIAFYGNYFFIVPKFFFSKKRIRFFLTLFIFTLGLLTISQFASKKIEIFKPPVRARNETELSQDENKRTNFLGLHPRILDDTFFLILIFGFSTGMSIVQKLRKDAQKQQNLEKANVENELAFLKNQINPHFFFNSLNNIYALIEIDGAQAQKSIETLSGLMRYLIYESESKKVPLKKEFDFSRHYIDLMRQRLTSKVELSVDITEDVPNVEVAPLLFIAFIENAFKHGVSYREKSFIDISLQVSEEKVVFHCNNSIPDTNETQSKQPGGVGIKNITKRLELLYGEQAQLTLKNRENIFTVELIIPIEVI